MFSRVEILLSRDWRHFPYEKKKVKYEHENCLLIDMLSKYRFFYNQRENFLMSLFTCNSQCSTNYRKTSTGQQKQRSGIDTEDSRI